MSMEIVFFSCTRGSAIGTPLQRSLNRLGIGAYQFVERNTQSLTSRYNQILDAHAGRDMLAVFVHDDVSINDPDVLPKLHTSAARFDVIGIVGAANITMRENDPYFTWAHLDRADLSGAVEHTLEPGVTFWSSYGNVPKRCVALDGMFLAVSLRKLGPIRFDERLAFHLYDIDFTLTCNQAGLVLGTTNIHCHHGSMGNAENEGYRKDFKTFWSKWLPGKPYSEIL